MPHTSKIASPPAPISQHTDFALSQMQTPSSFTEASSFSLNCLPYRSYDSYDNRPHDLKNGGSRSTPIYSSGPISREPSNLMAANPPAGYVPPFAPNIQLPLQPHNAVSHASHNPQSYSPPPITADNSNPTGFSYSGDSAWCDWFKIPLEGNKHATWAQTQSPYPETTAVAQAQSYGSLNFAHAPAGATLPNDAQYLSAPFSEHTYQNPGFAQVCYGDSGVQQNWLTASSLNVNINTSASFPNTFAQQRVSGEAIAVTLTKSRSRDSKIIEKIRQQTYSNTLKDYMRECERHAGNKRRAIIHVAREINIEPDIFCNYLDNKRQRSSNLKRINDGVEQLLFQSSDDVERGPSRRAFMKHDVPGAYDFAQPYVPTFPQLQPEATNSTYAPPPNNGF